MDVTDKFNELGIPSCEIKLNMLLRLKSIIQEHLCGSGDTLMTEVQHIKKKDFTLSKSNLMESISIKGRPHGISHKGEYTCFSKYKLMSFRADGSVFIDCGNQAVVNAFDQWLYLMKHALIKEKK